MFLIYPSLPADDVDYRLTVAAPTPPGSRSTSRRPCPAIWVRPSPLIAIFYGMADDLLMLRVDVRLDEDADAAELDAETVQLREELSQLDVDRVERPTSGPAPPGARAAEAAVLGALLVEVVLPLLGSVVRAIEDWVARRRTRSVKLTLGKDSIELSHVSDADQRRMLEAFLVRHVNPG